MTSNNDDLHSAEEIRNLLVRYGLFLDSKDFEGYVSYVIGLNTTKAPRLSVVRSGNTIRVAVTKT